MIDYYPDDQYQKSIEYLQKNPIPEKFRGLVFCPVEMLFITSDKQLVDLNYDGYPIFQEIGLSKDDFLRWNKYMDLDRESIEYKKMMRECICNMMAWQWKYSRLLEKKTGLITNNVIMHQYLLKLEELDKEIGCGFNAGYM